MTPLSGSILHAETHLLAAHPEHAKLVAAAAAVSERDGWPLKSFLPVILVDRV
jgi:hypothetical protein